MKTEKINGLGRGTRALILDRFLWLHFVLKSITAFETCCNIYN